MWSSDDVSLTADTKRLKIEMKHFTSKRGGRRRSSTSVTIPSSPKSPRSREKASVPTVVVLDNGVHTAKIGLSTDETPHIIPNCIMKVKSERKRYFIGNQIDDCRDLSGLYYMLAAEKGYITKWNIQKPVWDYMFNNICSIDDKPVILTQPLLNFKAIQEITDEIFFEEYEIKSMLRVNPTDLAKYEYTNKIVGNNKVPCLVVDSGFSFTHIVPYITGKKYYNGVIRLNVGGKVLTNHLKDIISYRQLHVMDETYVINQVKEDACYVSLNFKEDMRIAGLQGKENTIVKNYVLPDFNTIRRGYVQGLNDNSELPEGCQILRLNNERFTVPEILFYPSDIGMESMGVAENIVKSIRQCPIKDQPLLAKNIILIGGNASFPGYKERIYAEVRSYLPDDWSIHVFKPDNPITFAWNGGKSLAHDPKIKSLLITKEQYEETGSMFTYDRFSDWVHFKRPDRNENSESTEIKPPEGILNSGKFNRFDLFGKYELEANEASITDVESNQANVDNKSADDNADNKETKDKYQEAEADVHQDDTNDSINKINEKGNKNKTLVNQQTDYDYSKLLNSNDTDEIFEPNGFDFSYV